jgi:hypothetical protein
MSRTLRPRSYIDYSSESKTESEITNESASRWDKTSTEYRKIKVDDVIDIHELFPEEDLPKEAKLLIMPDWERGEWLIGVNLKTAPYNDNIKTLIKKIRKVFVSEQESMAEVFVDGYMQTLLQFLGFDSYPCSLYPQYEYKVPIGQKNKPFRAKPDFSVLSEEDKIMLVVEDKNVTSATFPNNWKEDQVMAELFAAVHYIVSKAKAELTYPIIVYAVRVIGTKFTFYKAQAGLEYIKESARDKLSGKEVMVVQRHPPVAENPRLTAYDICNKDDRMNILECLCSIRRWICNAYS